ncbi:HdeD family acid-resistance protein [Methylomarinum vadi]|uniref:HdeD family acid-resistance protein n=1 Tax=Methylomarinum vadi TaxID=438855 RepID=UPI0004DFB530|nr:DUF308 domain-containing protein [Methylomarinum vadi]
MEKPKPIDLQQMREAMLSFLQQHWKIFLLEGLIFVILGTLAVIAPHVSTIGITLFLGWLLLLGGIVQLVRSVGLMTMPGFGLWFFIGAAQTAVGYYLIKNPTQGSLTLTLIITVFFVIEGISKVSLALMMRPLAHWGSMFFTGITAICFAFAVWLGWPETGYWVLGLFLGVNMMLLGWVLIRISLHHKTTS